MVPFGNGSGSDPTSSNGAADERAHRARVTRRPPSNLRRMTKPNLQIALGALGAVAAQLFLLTSADAAAPVVFRIYNDTTVPITELYDKDPHQGFWGVSDLESPLQPAHLFYIKFTQSSYSHCPNKLRDVKLVFANGATKVYEKIDVCKYDIHVHKP
jgi:hypothetical protein